MRNQTIISNPIKLSTNDTIHCVTVSLIGLLHFLNDGIDEVAIKIALRQEHAQQPQQVIHAEFWETHMIEHDNRIFSTIEKMETTMLHF